MIRTAPIRFTPNVDRWHEVLRALGCTFVTQSPGWQVARAGSGVVALHAATDPYTELWFETKDPAVRAQACGGSVEPKPADGQPDPCWVATMPDGMRLGFSAWTDQSMEGADARLSVAPLWVTPRVGDAAATLVRIGGRRRISSATGDWVDLTMPDGLMAVHIGATAAAVLGFEWDGDVDDLAVRLADHGFEARVIDESYGRSLRVDDPDGGDEIWINERQTDLYGYRVG